MTKEILEIASYDDKLALIKLISKEITNFSESNYKRIDDLLLLCEDKNIDVILAAVKQLVFVFCDILPDYKVREDLDTEKEGQVMLSKNVKKVHSPSLILQPSIDEKNGAILVRKLQKIPTSA